MRELTPEDFKVVKYEGVIHGWVYEDERYFIEITLCWDGCDVSVMVKRGRLQRSKDHVKRSEPSFQDKDVAQALVIANLLLNGYELTPDTDK